MKIRVTKIAGTLSLAIGIALLTPYLFGRPRVAAQHRSSSMPTIAAITSPAAANAAEPQLTVSNRGVLLSWIEHAGSSTTLRFAERTPAGWTEPRTAASGHDWSVNAIDVPSVLRLSNGTLVAQWLQRSGSSMHANDVRLSYSKDDGRTWAASVTPYAESGPRDRLFASLFEMPGPALGLVWLDGGAMTNRPPDAQRAGPTQAHGADHARQHGGVHQGQPDHKGRGEASGAGMSDMSLRFASFDGAWKQTASMPIDPRVCDCCSTAAAVTSEGVLAAYRNRSDDAVRDIYVSRLVEGRWTEPAVAHADNWRIPLCPINGPALSASGRYVALAWYTMKREQGHSYVAFSPDAGRRFGEPIRLDDAASLGRVDVELLPDGSALTTWIEVADGRSQFRARRVEANGTRSAAVTIAGLNGSRTAPRLARAGDELIFTWTETNGDTSQVRTAAARWASTLAR